MLRKLLLLLLRSLVTEFIDYFNQWRIQGGGVGHAPPRHVGHAPPRHVGHAPHALRHRPKSNPRAVLEQKRLDK